MERDRPHPTPATLESLFLRWREKDDAEALGEMLARTEAELIAVARRQARDDAGAWDLVQEAWVTVLREGHKWDSSQRLMPWLVGILTICARRARRVDARTPDPDRLEQREVLPPDAAVPADEVRTLIERGLGNVSTLYGDVVRMHLFEEMTHAEIAERTGREPGTVRVQVFRGLAQLRKHLPSSLSLGVAIVALAPRSEAARLAPVLDTAFGAGPAIGPAIDAGPAIGAGARTGAGTTSTAASVGGLAGSALRWWLGIAAAATVAGGVWWATTDAGERDAGSTPQLVAGEARTKPAPEPLSAGVEDAQRSVASAAAAPDTVRAPPPGVWLVGEVRGLDRLPRATSTVTLRPGGTKRAPTTERLELTARRAETARFEIDLTAWFAPGSAAPRDFIALLDHPHALPARSSQWLSDERLAAAVAAAAAGSTQRFEIPAPFDLVLPTARVHGRVTTGVGLDPALRTADAVVGLFEIDERGQPALEPIEGGRVRADGTFTLRAAKPGAHRVVAALPGIGSRPADAALQLVLAEEREVGELVVEAGAQIAGRVVGVGAAGGNDRVSFGPIEKSRIHSAHGVPLAWLGGRFETAGGDVDCAADGTFRIPGLARAEYLLRAGSGPGFGTGTGVTLDASVEGASPRHALSEQRVVAPAQGLVLELALFDVILRVTGGGAPLEFAQLERHADGSSSSLRTDAEGRVTLRTSGIPGPVRLRLSKVGWMSKMVDLTHVRFEPGAELHVDLEPGPAPAELVLDAGAISLAGTVLTLVPWESTDEARREEARRKGGLGVVEGATIRKVTEGGRLDAPVEPGHWFASLQILREGVSPELEYARPALFELDLAPGATVRHVVNLERGGRLRFQPMAAVPGVTEATFEFESADGVRVSMPLTSLVLRGDARQGRKTTKDRLALGVGAESALLEPGLYTLRTTVGANTTTRTVEVRTGETTVVE